MNVLILCFTTFFFFFLLLGCFKLKVEHFWYRVMNCFVQRNVVWNHVECKSCQVSFFFKFRLRKPHLSHVGISFYCFQFTKRNNSTVNLNWPYSLIVSQSKVDQLLRSVLRSSLPVNLGKATTLSAFKFHMKTCIYRLSDLFLLWCHGFIVVQLFHVVSWFLVLSTTLQFSCFNC